VLPCDQDSVDRDPRSVARGQSNARPNRPAIIGIFLARVIQPPPTGRAARYRSLTPSTKPTVFAGIAEFERDLIRERTTSGRAAAKQRGVRFGRPRKLNPDQAQVASQLLAEGKTVRDIARTFNVHEATIYRLAAAM
jgi:DNA invertase Pin-like site-specific DNA recombinase